MGQITLVILMLCSSLWSAEDAPAQKVPEPSLRSFRIVDEAISEEPITLRV